MESEWIQYYPRGNNPVEMPTSGYVEYTDTFFGDERTYMTDRSIRSVENDIIWNRAAPNCVAKFRYISEQTYLTGLIKHLEKLIDDENKKIKEYQELLDKHNTRLLGINSIG